MMNKLKINLIGMSFAVVIILAPTVVYGFECGLRNVGVGGSCGSETCVYSMSSDTNAHVGDCDAYSWKMCCDGLTSATIETDDCSVSGKVGVLSLSATSDAHAEKYNFSDYPNNVCIEPESSNIVCEYKADCGGDACLGSLFSETNSHIAKCNHYNTNICCAVSVPEGTCDDHNVEGWAWSSNIGWISFSCEDNYGTGTGSDYGVDINTETQEFSGYAWSSNVGWISFNQTDLTGCDDGNCIAELVNGEVFGWAKVLSSGEFIKLRETDAEKIEYGVSLSDGEFSGWAYGDQTTGWISFNCADRDVCGTGEGQSNYKVTTSFSPPHDKPSGLTIKWDDCSFRQKSIPTFSWEYNGTGDSDGYEIWIDNDLGFVDYIEILAEGTESINYTHNTIAYKNDGPDSWPTVFEWGEPYYWKVKTKDTLGDWSGWSDTETFDTHIHAYPWVDFSYSPSSPIVNNQIQFCSMIDEADCSGLTENLSEVYDGSTPENWSWSWDFNKDEVEDSDVYNPTHTYTIPGFFESMLSLTITDLDNFSCTKTPDIEIDLPLPIWKEIMPF